MRPADLLDPDPLGISKSGTMTGPRRWGGRFLLTNDPVLLNPPLGTQPVARQRVTAIDTQDLGFPREIALQVRFALPTVNVVFSPIFPIVNLTSVPYLLFKVRRGLDPTSGVIDQDEVVIRAPEQFPLDIVAARSLGIDIELFSGAPPNTTIWVDIVAIPVTQAAQRAQIPGWVLNTQEIYGTIFHPAVTTDELLLPENPARVQFIVVNTSSANMILSFGGLPIWPVSGAIILPGGRFAHYESPRGGYVGSVTATWEGPGPLTGGALVTEGMFTR